MSHTLTFGGRSTEIEDSPRGYATSTTKGTKDELVKDKTKSMNNFKLTAT